MKLGSSVHASVCGSWGVLVCRTCIRISGAQKGKIEGIANCLKSPGTTENMVDDDAVHSLTSASRYTLGRYRLPNTRGLKR